MADPGAIGSQVPPGDDEVWKQLKALQNRVQQAVAAAGNAQALATAIQAGLGMLASSGTTWAGPVASPSTVTAGTDITASGNMAAGGNVSSSGQVISAGIVRSPGSRAYNVVPAGGFAGTWQDGSGNFGFNASGVEVKQDFEPADLADVADAVLRLGLLRFRYIADVEEHGEDAPWYLGSIAQYLAAGPLREWVSELPGGTTINWEHMGIPLVAGLQRTYAEVTALKNELNDLKALVANLNAPNQ